LFEANLLLFETRPTLVVKKWSLFYIDTLRV